MSTLERLGITPRSIVLDVGFGTVDELVTLSKLVGAEGTVYGIEPDESLVANAVAQLSETRNVRPMVGSVLKVPFPNESVDVVLFQGTMHHVKDPIGAIREAKRVCRKDGRIVIVDFIPFPERWLRWPNLKWRLRHPGKLWANPPDKHPGFSEHDVRTLLESLTLERYESNFAPGHHSGHDVPVFLAIARKVESTAG